MVKTDNSIQEDMKRGTNLLLEGKYEQAETVYRQITEQKPDYPWVNCNLGRSLLHQGKVEAAIPYLQKAIELDPNIAEAYSSLGNGLTKQNRFEEAVNAYQKAIELEPQQFLYHHQLGDSLLMQEKYEEAVSPYRKAIKLNSEYVWSHYNLGRALSELGKWEEAIAVFQKAVKLNPNFADIHRYLGDALFNRQRWSEAITTYKQAIKLQSQQPFWLYKNLGDALKQQRQFDEAAAAYKNAIYINPDLGGLIYEDLGEALSQSQVTIETTAQTEHSKKQAASKPSVNATLDQDRPFSKVIFAANPSHAAKEEDTFWKEVAVAAKKRGWQLVELAARKIPLIPEAKTMIMPARLWQVCQKMKHLDPVGLEDNLPWVDRSFLHVLEDWEHRRWELDYFEPEVYTGVVRLANLIDTAVRSLRPAVILTTNKIDHPVALSRMAGLYAGAYTAFIERSPFDDIWLEPDGIFAESTIWSDYKRERNSLSPEVVKKGQEIIAGLIGNPYGFRKQENHQDSDANLFSSLKRPIFFLPIDNVLWTGFEQEEHPQRLVDYPIYTSPNEAIKILAEHIQELGGSLVVKKHPSCKHIDSDGSFDNVVFYNGDLSFMLQMADVVVTFLTKVAFPALALGKPTVTLAYNPVAASGSTYHCTDEGQVKQTLEAALNRRDLFQKLEAFKPFVGWLSGKFYAYSDKSLTASGKGPQALVDDLIAAAGDRISQESEIGQPEVLENIERLVIGNKQGYFVAQNTDSPKSPLIIQKTAPNLINIAFDVNRLADRKVYHSGISRYTRELITHLQNSENISLYPVVTRKIGIKEPFPQQAAQELRQFCGDNTRFFKDITQPYSKNTTSLRSPRWDIFHTPIGPLPSRQFTGDAIRIVTIHDCLHLKYPEFYPNPGKKPAIQHTLESIDVKKDFIICDSESTKQDFLSLLPINEDRVTVIPLAADSLFFSPSPTIALSLLNNVGIKPHKYCLALCQKDPRKNIDNFLEAAGQLYREGKLLEYNILLVTRSAHRQWLEQQVEAAGLPKSCCKILFDLDDQQLASLYRIATLFAYIPLYEGFGLPALEAMAAGCPVVVSDCSSLPEVVGDAGVYVKPKEIQSIKEGIHKVLSNPSFREDLVVNAKRQAAQFSWEKTNSMNLMFYRHAIEFVRNSKSRKLEN